ncbi:Disease resistance protein RPM1, partial [Glycine soja]
MEARKRVPHVLWQHKDFHNNFECHAWITVSQSYTVEELLKDTLHKLCKEKLETPLHNDSLIDEMRNHLRHKRYVVLFHDVWDKKFSDGIDFAIIDKNSDTGINHYFGHRLRSFAFFSGFGGCCTKEYEDVGLEMVRKCERLPLAIVALVVFYIANVKVHLNGQYLKRKIGLSYDDFLFNLRSCLLYFRMYPEDYEVKSGRLITQWIAEGFVKHENGRTLEEVAQQHLMELITTSLVQVSSFTIDDKVKGCRVHDLIHEMILGNIKDTWICLYIDEHNQLVSSAIVRRLTIGSDSNDLIENTERSRIRSVLIFTKQKLPEYLISGILEKYIPLKIESLPKSIGKLQNLETLDVRQTKVFQIPKEISKLLKLRHLLANEISSIAVK